MEKNRGVLTAPPKPSDYVLGGEKEIISSISVKDWSFYLPSPENQFSTEADFDICVTMSGVDHSVGTYLNYFLMNNMLSDEALNFFHNNGYIRDGLFALSSRWSAKMNGTEKQKGNFLNAVADSARLLGFVPDSKWPTTADMTWQEFYAVPPAALTGLAKKVLWFIGIGYQWVDKSNIVSFQHQGPVQSALALCPHFSSPGVIPTCSGLSLSHAVLNYDTDILGNFLIFDHYNPYKKELASDYELPLNIQYVVTLKPPTLRNGMQGKNVLAMQKNLNKLGYNLLPDGDFGQKTETAVKNFQNKSGLKPDGLAGPLTLAKLSELSGPRQLVDAVILVESEGNDNAEGDINLENHAYGALQIRQGVCDDVNRKFGTNYRSIDCLGNRAVTLDIWTKYWLVYPTIVSDEDRARAWNGGPGWKQIYFKAQKTTDELKYCRNLDIYWSKVKSLLQ